MSSSFPNLVRILGIEPLTYVPFSALEEPREEAISPSLRNLFLYLITSASATTISKIDLPVEEDTRTHFASLSPSEKADIELQIWKLDGEKQEWGYGKNHCFDKKLTFINAVFQKVHSSISNQDSIAQHVKTLSSLERDTVRMHLYILCNLQKSDSAELFGNDNFNALNHLKEKIDEI